MLTRSRFSGLGISTVVGMALFVLVAIALLTTIYIVFNTMINTLNKVMNLATYRITESQLANSITGWWTLQGSTLVINITNNAPISIEITSIAVVLSNGSYVALYKDHTDSATVTIVYPSGLVTTQALSMPLALGTGYSVNISIPGIITAIPKSISAAVTASPIVLSIPIKPYTPTTLPTSKPSVYLLKLMHYAGSGTIAILKEAQGATYSYVMGTINSLAIQALSYEGTSSNIETIDGNYLNVTSVKISPTILFINRTARIYTNFTENPFTQPLTSPMYLLNYSSTPTGAWSWGSYGYVDGGIDYSDSLTAYVLLGTYTTPDLSVGLAYNNVTAFSPSQSNWSIYTKIYVPPISSSNFTTSGSISYIFLDVAGTAFIENTTFYYISGIAALYNSSTSSTSYYIAIANATSNGITIFMKTLPITPGWYIVLSEYNYSNHSIEVFVYALNGTLIANYNLIDTSSIRPNPLYSGVGTIYYLNPVSSSGFLSSVSITSDSYFDDLLAGYGNISVVKVIGLTPGYVVTITNSSGLVVSSASASAYGTALLNVITQPILTNATLTVSSAGSVLVSNAYNLVLGGDTYMYIPTHYQATINISSFVNLSRVINNTNYWSLYLEVYFVTNNTYVNVSILAYNIDTGHYDTVGTATNVISLDNTYLLSPPTSYLNTTSGIINATLIVYSLDPFNLSIDMFNAKLHALVLNSTAPLLMIGIGGTTYIDVYQVATYVTGPSIRYLYSINAHTIFNGTASITYDPIDHYLFLLNETGIYYSYIVPNANFTLLNVSSVCRATGLGAQIAFINVSNHPFLLVLPGDGNTTMCIINVSSGTVSTISVNPGYAYSVSAYNNSCAWFIVNDSGAPELIQVCSSSPTSPVAILNASTFKNVGLAYCASLSKLVLLAEGGPSYIISPDLKTIDKSFNPPFYPVGIGDRIGCYNGYVFFVRADDTNELWIWRVS